MGLDRNEQIGIVAVLNPNKGFGFIDTGAAKYFFHRSAVRDTTFDELCLGDRVAFTAEDSERGPRAGTVRAIDG